MVPPLNEEKRQPKPRTGQQNRALHKFYAILATSLNDAGLDMKKVLKPGISIPWTPQMVKEHLWRPIQQVMLHKKSTTELEKLGDIDRIHEVLMRELGLAFHIEYIPLPSKCEKCEHIDCICPSPFDK